MDRREREREREREKAAGSALWNVIRMEVGSSNLYDAPQWLFRNPFDDNAYSCVPQHKIFISHSGRQKDFAEQLCKDLEARNYFPFFDKQSDSLPKGQHFPSRIFKAAEECSLAIVLLSQDFFTRSKWPMMELSAFVEARQKHQHVQILPVLLDSLCPEDLNDTTISTWSQHYWSKWEASDKHVTSDDICKWKIAIKALRPLTMILQSKHDGEVPVRNEIVSAVLRLISPDIQPDVSHIQGKERLYQEIIALFSSAEASPLNNICNAATIVGVYGIAGSGKTTLCMILTHYLRGEFEGRVCHVDLGKEDMSTLNLQINVMEKLTTVNHDYLHKYIKTEEEGWTCLMKYISSERIFLALDSVSDKLESLEFARKFVSKVKYHVNSMVLVTSRSKDILYKHLGILESSCMHCSHLMATEALAIVLDHLSLDLQVERLTEEQRNILETLVKICDWGGHIHPMALKVLASQLGRNPSHWKLSDLSLLESSEKEHPLLAAMEKYFKRLPDRQTKDMFMDIALFAPEAVSNVHDMCLWLKGTLHPSCSDLDSVRRKLDVLRLKSLLEVWSIDSDNVRIHDLHHQLARRMARVENATENKPPKFVYQIGGNVAPTEILGTRLAERIQRACLVGSSCTVLVFDGCSSLKLLSLRSCNNLARLEITGLGTLVSLELSACPLRILDLRALISLRWLCLTSCQDLVGLDATDCKHLARVYISKCIQLEVLNLRSSIELEFMSLSYNNSLQLVDLGSGKCLQCLTLWFCEALRILSMSESVCLSEFKKRGCPWLMNVHGCNRMSESVSCLVLTRWHRVAEAVITALQGSIFLQVLDLWDCPLSRMPDLRKCLRLKELKLTDVDVLLHTDNRKLVHEYANILCATDDELALPSSLQEVTIVECRNTAVKEICWKLHGLTSLSVLLMQRVRVSWEWELYRSNTKAYCKTQSSLPLDVTNLRNVLHEMIDKAMMLEIASDEAGSTSYALDVEPEMTSINEEEGFMDEEIASTDSDEVMSCDSIEMPGDVPNFSDQIAQFKCPTISTSHELKMRIDSIKYLYHAIYWIHKFVGLRNQLGNEVEIKIIIERYWQKLPSVQSLPLEEYESEGEDWIRLFMSCEMGKVQYRSPEYVFLETFHNFDMLWPKVMESILPFTILKEFTIRQLRRQLFVVRTLGPGPYTHFGDWEPWEHKVLEEIFAFENLVEFVEPVNAKERMMWERYGGDGILFSCWRVFDLENKLLSLMKLRNWSFEGDEQVELTTDLAEREKWKQEWLVSCKVCMSMQVLGVMVRGINALEEDDLCWHQGWLADMIQEVEQKLMQQLQHEHYGFREWKVYHWLRNLVKLVEPDVREKLVFGASLWRKVEGEYTASIQWVDELLIRLLEVDDQLSVPQWRTNNIEEDGWRITSLHPSNGPAEAAFYDILHMQTSRYYSSWDDAIQHMHYDALQRQLKLLQLAFQLTKAQLTLLRKGSTEPELHMSSLLRANLDAFSARIGSLPISIFTALLCSDRTAYGTMVRFLLAPLKAMISKLEGCRQSKRACSHCDQQTWSNTDVKFPLFKKTWDAINQQPFVLPIHADLRHLHYQAYSFNT